MNNLTWQHKCFLIKSDPVTATRYFNNLVQRFIHDVLKSNLHPIGVIDDYMYRVEFQQRGSPHIHMMIWIKDAPQYEVDSNEVICTFVDRFITCDPHVDITKIPVNLQIHNHSQSCKKGKQNKCRFNFPAPPMFQTTILDPLEDPTETDIANWKKVCDELNSYKVSSWKEDAISHEEFLLRLGLTEQEYLRAVRCSIKSSKLLLKRQPNATRVNAYNKHLLQIWKANLDIQYILDPYACAMYIVSYISKAQRGMSDIMKRACVEAKESGSELHNQVRSIGNQFLRSVEIGAQ